MVMLMNNYQQLFIDLKIKLTNEIYEKCSKQINEIARTQKKSVFTILDEIAKIILEYNVKNEVMDISIHDKAKLKKQMNDFGLEIKKEEYDYLKWIEHEYVNLTSEIEHLIESTDSLLLRDELCFDTSKINIILKRYFEDAYYERIAELKKEESK